MTRYVAMLALARRPWITALLFCSQAVVAILVLAILVPPFENSDEFNHAKRADEISAGSLLATRFDGPNSSGGRVDTGIDRVDGIIGVVRFHPERKVSGEMMRQAGAIAWGDRTEMTFANTAIYAPILYLPAAVGLFVGKHLGLSIVHTLTIARAMNGVASVLIASAAIMLAGDLALLLMLLLSLPMCISLFASLSQDGLMIGLSALAAAAVAKAAHGATRGLPVILLVTWASLALVCLGRPSYAPLALLPLVLPAPSLRWRCVGVAASLVPLAAWSYISARFTMINTEAHRGVEPLAQLAGLLSHPDRIAGLAIHAVTDRQGMEGLPFYKEFLGVLGWLDVVLPSWFYVLACIALGLGFLVSIVEARPALTVRARLAVTAMASAAIFLTFLLEYLTWTPVGFSFVEGVQGRYFLPVAMVLPLALPGFRNSALSSLCAPLSLTLRAFPTLSVAFAITAVVRRYYL